MDVRAVPKPLDFDSRLRALGLEERQRLARARNAHVRYQQHRDAARQEKANLRALIIELRRFGVPTRTIAMAVGWSKSYVSRFGRLPGTSDAS